MYLPASDHATLRRLAAWHGKTIRQWLCDTAQEQEQKVLGMLLPEGEQWHRYFGLDMDEEKNLDALLLMKKQSVPALDLQPDRYVWACPDCGHLIEAKTQGWITRCKSKHSCSELLAPKGASFQY